jgi:hypothetical protein
VQSQRFGGLEVRQISFDFRVSAYVQIAEKFDQRNFAEMPLIGPGKQDSKISKIGDALLAARFYRFNLFAFARETVATQLGTSHHIRYAIAERFRRTADTIKDLFRTRVQSGFAFAINALPKGHIYFIDRRISQPYNWLIKRENQ